MDTNDSAAVKPSSETSSAAAMPGAAPAGAGAAPEQNKPSTRKLPPAVRLVKTAAPAAAQAAPGPAPAAAEQANIAFRLQIADQIWRYVAHGIVMTDAAGMVLCANPAFVNMLHYTVEQELLNRNIRSFLAVATDLDSVIRHLHERCICAKRVSVITREAAMLPAQITASPVFLPDGRLRYMIFSLDDATADLEAEKLREQTAMQTQAAAMSQARLAAIAELSYALNDPLQNLLGLAEEDQRADYQEQITRVIEIVRKFYSPSEPPAESSAADPAPPVAQAPALPAGLLTPCARDTLMVADDEPLIRRLFDRLLSDAFPQLRIELADNGERAVELFNHGHHAVIIMDVMMPGMRGDEAFKRIVELCDRNHWDPPHFIFCTGFMPPEAVTAIARDPRHALLRKPVSRKEVVAVTQRFLSRTPAPPADEKS